MNPHASEKSSPSTHHAAATPTQNLNVNFYWLELQSITLPSASKVLPFLMIGTERFQLAMEALQTVAGKPAPVVHTRRAYIPFERKAEILTVSVGITEANKTYSDVLYVGQIDLDRSKFDANPRNTQLEVRIENMRDKEGGSIKFAVIHQTFHALDVQEINEKRAKIMADMRVQQLLLDIALLNPYNRQASDQDEATIIAEYNYELFSRVRQRILAYKPSSTFEHMRLKFNNKIQAGEKAQVPLNSWLHEKQPALPRADTLKIP